MLIKLLWMTDKGWSYILVVCCKKVVCYKILHRTSELNRWCLGEMRVLSGG